MSENFVIVNIEGHVGVITLNRPEKHNAMNDEAQEQFQCAITSVATDDNVRCLLLRGEGKSFCAGRDVSVLGHRANGESDFDFIQNAQKIQLAILNCPKPVVAAVKGAAIGGGFEFALAADFRIIGKAAKLSLPEIKFGLLPDLGGMQLLANIIGRSRAKYLAMTGATISGEQAFEWGIADWLVDDNEVDTKAMKIAGELAAAPPQAASFAKALVDQASSENIRRGIEQELNAQSILFMTEDYAEARKAISEKRAPKYKGK